MRTVTKQILVLVVSFLVGFSLAGCGININGSIDIDGSVDANGTVNIPAQDSSEEEVITEGISEDVRVVANSNEEVVAEEDPAPAISTIYTCAVTMNASASLTYIWTHYDNGDTALEGAFTISGTEISFSDERPYMSNSYLNGEVSINEPGSSWRWNVWFDQGELRIQRWIVSGSYQNYFNSIESVCEVSQ